MQSALDEREGGWLDVAQVQLFNGTLPECLLLLSDDALELLEPSDSKVTHRWSLDDFLTVAQEERVLSVQLSVGWWWTRTITISLSAIERATTLHKLILERKERLKEQRAARRKRVSAAAQHPVTDREGDEHFEKEGDKPSSPAVTEHAPSTPELSTPGSSGTESSPEAALNAEADSTTEPVHVAAVPAVEACPMGGDATELNAEDPAARASALLEALAAARSEAAAAAAAAAAEREARERAQAEAEREKRQAEAVREAVAGREAELQAQLESALAAATAAAAVREAELMRERMNEREQAAAAAAAFELREAELIAESARLSTAAASCRVAAEAEAEAEAVGGGAVAAGEAAATGGEVAVAAGRARVSGVGARLSRASLQTPPRLEPTGFQGHRRSLSAGQPIPQITSAGQQIAMQKAEARQLLEQLRWQCVSWNRIGGPASAGAEPEAPRLSCACSPTAYAYLPTPGTYACLPIPCLRLGAAGRASCVACVSSS